MPDSPLTLHSSPLTHLLRWAHEEGENEEEVRLVAAYMLVKKCKTLGNWMERLHDSRLIACPNTAFHDALDRGGAGRCLDAFLC